MRWPRKFAGAANVHKLQPADTRARWSSCPLAAVGCEWPAGVRALRAACRWVRFITREMVELYKQDDSLDTKKQILLERKALIQNAEKQFVESMGIIYDES